MRQSQLLFTTLAILLVSAVAQNEEEGFEIDNALDLLDALRQDSATNLSELDKNNEINTNSLNKQLEDLTGQVSTKTQECDDLAVTAKKTSDEVDDTIKYITWLKNSIDSKGEKLQHLLDQRCEVNKVFIHGIAREKLALSLLQFIETAIQNKQSFSLAQKDEYNHQLFKFIQAYQNNDLTYLLQMKKDAENIDANQYNVDVDFTTQARTNDEIGTGHVDNNKGDLQLEDFTSAGRKDWSLYKTELIQILEELKAKINEKIKNSIADEINASVALANYKNTILHEIAIYKKELAKQEKLLPTLQSQLQTDQQNEQTCTEELGKKSAQKYDVEQELAQKSTDYATKRASIEEEISIFDEVINGYKNGVWNNDDAFKERADDYIDDQNFDNGSYNEREVPKIETLNPTGQGSQDNIGTAQ